MELHTVSVDPAVVLASVASAILAAVLLLVVGGPKVRFSFCEDSACLCCSTRLDDGNHLQKYANKNLPPGPKPDFLVGNRNQVPSIKPWRWFKKLNDQYGDMFLIWMGRTPVVVIGSAQVAWDLLGKKVVLCFTASY